jgi:hypothetical protein
MHAKLLLRRIPVRAIQGLSESGPELIMRHLEIEEQYLEARVAFAGL